MEIDWSIWVDGMDCLKGFDDDEGDIESFGDEDSYEWDMQYLHADVIVGVVDAGD